MRKKNSILNLFAGVLIIIFGLIWIYFSYKKTAHFRASDDYIMGYIFPIMGIVFIMMGVIAINSYFKAKNNKYSSEEMLDHKYYDEDTFSSEEKSSFDNAYSGNRIRRRFKNISSKKSSDTSNEDTDQEDDYDFDIPKFEKNYEERYQDSSNEFNEGQAHEKTKYFQTNKKQYKFCPYCGSQLKGDFKYCPECGEKLK